MGSNDFVVLVANRECETRHRHLNHSIQDFLRIQQGASSLSSLISGEVVLPRSLTQSHASLAVSFLKTWELLAPTALPKNSGLICGPLGTCKKFKFSRCPRARLAEGCPGRSPAGLDNLESSSLVSSHLSLPPS